MDIRLLKLYSTLAEMLHFAKAAAACHMTPSAVSRAVNRLEEEVGQVLLIRDNREVQLTPAGVLFKEYANEVLARWELLQHQLTVESKTLQGELKIYCSVTASYSILASILPVFRQRYPGIEIQLYTGDQADAIPRVLAGDEDLSIAAHPGVLPIKLQFQTLTYSPLRFIMPASDCALAVRLAEMLANGAELDWQVVPLIMPEHGLARKRLEHWLKTTGVKPNIYAYVSGHEALVAMVGLGFGVGVVPELVILHSPFREKVRMIELPPQMEPFAIGLCVLRQRMENPLVKAFWSVAMDINV